MPASYDVILVGAGLANGLIALTLRERHPALRLLVIERDAQPGGNHTWSFHDGDLSAAQQRWIAPLVARRWPDHSVRFPQRARVLGSGYASILSDTFARHLRAVLGDALRCGTEVSTLSATCVTLATGQVLTASVVIDGRGPQDTPHMAMGHQVFLGQVLRTAAPHGVARPLLMDADVAQGQGYRFVYLLPFAEDVLLVEDTHYVDASPPPTQQLRANIADYVHARGWAVAEILREEQGMLPITLSGDIDAFWGVDRQPRSGLRAGLFHATTGYSLPHAMRLADKVARLPRLDAASVFEAIRACARSEWKKQAFFRLLNRMLFLAGRPQDRWRVMQRFYGLPEALISRFYAGRLTVFDRLRILIGKPPVPLAEAYAAMRATDLHHRRASE